jgi:hypothetical protein
LASNHSKAEGLARELQWMSCGVLQPGVKARTKELKDRNKGCMRADDGVGQRLDGLDHGVDIS